MGAWRNRIVLGAPERDPRDRRSNHHPRAASRRHRRLRPHVGRAWAWSSDLHLRVQLHYRVRHGLGLGQPLVAKGDESGVAIGLVEAFTENGPSALQQRVTSSFTSGRLLYVLQTLDKLRG